MRRMSGSDLLETTDESAKEEFSDVSSKLD